jgi:hypothetical protein
MKNIRLISVIFVCLFFSLNSFGQIEKFKALYIFNFLKYFEWPASSKTGDFIIGVYGNDDIIPHLETIAMKKKLGYQNIVVSVFKSLTDIKPCQLIYIPSSKSGEFQQIAGKILNSSTLVICDDPDLIKQGSAISFFDDSGELKFEISKGNIEKTNLKINSNLYSMGVAVQ